MPILVYTHKGSWDKYFASLDCRARTEWKTLKKKFDWEYGRFEFDREIFEKFIKIWENQEILNARRTYGNSQTQPTTLDMFDKERDYWMYFAARQNDTVMAIHPIRFWNENGDKMSIEDVESGKTFAGNGVQWTELWTPLYDKKIDRDIAGFMWYNLIHYAFDHHLPMLNFIGGEKWRDLLKEKRSNNLAYKWRFVPRWVKRDPDGQPNYIEEGRKIYELLGRNL